jgi:uncharacterized protein (TIGR03086 family)
MSTARNDPRPDPPSGTEAFRQALRYALAATEHMRPELMPRPTPCQRWDLRMLLMHAAESLDALSEGFAAARVDLASPAAQSDVAADPGFAFRQRAWTLLVSCGRADSPGGLVTVGGCPMAAGLLATAGALEIAVHGWDIARACGSPAPIPAPLAGWLLRVAPSLITPADRRDLFSPPVPVPAGADVSDCLAAYLGRAPRYPDRAEGGSETGV